MNQERLSQKLVGPGYINPNTGRPIGTKGIPNIQKVRGLQISRDYTSVENLKVGIRDIDEAVVYYLSKVIKPQIEVNGTVQDVPIQYATPERWLEVQRNGQFRDKDGKKQLPVIILKRNSLTANRGITTKLDANRPHNFYVTAVNKQSSRNSYTRFDLIRNRVPEVDLIMTVVPDYITLEYSCLALTDLISQTNPIIEAIKFASDSYWGDPEKFMFQVFVGPFRTDISSGQSEDRVVKTSFDLKLNGYILPDTPNASMHTGMLRHNKTNVSCKIVEKVVKEI